MRGGEGKMFEERKVWTKREGSGEEGSERGRGEEGGGEKREGERKDGQVVTYSMEESTHHNTVTLNNLFEFQVPEI